MRNGENHIHFRNYAALSIILLIRSTIIWISPVFESKLVYNHSTLVSLARPETTVSLASHSCCKTKTQTHCCWVDLCHILLCVAPFLLICSIYRGASLIFIWELMFHFFVPASCSPKGQSSWKRHDRPYPRIFGRPFVHNFFWFFTALWLWTKQVFLTCLSLSL